MIRKYRIEEYNILIPLDPQENLRNIAFLEGVAVLGGLAGGSLIYPSAVKGIAK